MGVIWTLTGSVLPTQLFLIIYLYVDSRFLVEETEEAGQAVNLRHKDFFAKRNNDDPWGVRKTNNQ